VGGDAHSPLDGKALHYVLHAPQGDTHADLLFTMIERVDRRPPSLHHVSGPVIWAEDTAELVTRFDPAGGGPLPPRGPARGRELHGGN